MYLGSAFPHWGDVSSWATVGATLTAAGGAIWAAVYAAKTFNRQKEQVREQREFIGEQSANLNLERQQLRMQAERERRTQASLIKLDVQRHQPVFSEGRPTGAGHVAALVLNQSGGPIHTVTARFNSQWPNGNFRYNNVRPVSLDDSNGDPVRETIRSNESRGFFWKSVDPDEIRLIPVVASFRDLANVTWFLDEDGHLTERKPGDWPA